MHLHRSGACGIALILVILAITCEISSANKQCKTIVMDVHMKRCRLGTERAKRGLERFDLQKYDEKFEAKRQEGPDYSKMKDSTWHSIPQKRQLTPGQVGGIALPIVTEAINSAAKARAYSTSGTEYHNSSPSLTGSVFGWPGYLIPPYPLGGSFTPLRPTVSQSPLGSILSFGKRTLVEPKSISKSILQSVKPLYSYGLNRFL